MPAAPASVPPPEFATLLRGETETFSAWSGQWNSRRIASHLAIIIVGAGLYGAAMGWWRAPQQGLFVAIKFPLIILLTTLGNALLNGLLAPLLGLNTPCWNFSHSRGTEMNSVGRARCRSCKKVSSDSAK